MTERKERKDYVLDYVLRFRISAAQARQIRAAAQDHGERVSAYIRRVLLQHAAQHGTCAGRGSDER